MFTRRSILKLAAVPFLPPIPLAADRTWYFVLPGIARVPMTKMAADLAKPSVLMMGTHIATGVASMTQPGYIEWRGQRIAVGPGPWINVVCGDQVNVSYRMECGHTGIDPTHLLKMVQSGLNPVLMPKAEICEWLAAKGLPAPSELFAAMPGTRAYA